MVDFFANQHKAYSHTKKLIFYFMLALIAIIILVNLAIFAITIYIAGYDNTLTATQIKATFFEYPFWQISLAIAALIIGTSLFKYWQLLRGNKDILDILMARQIAADSDNFNEKQLLNVVTEMSIASGMPVPKVYVLDTEYGINAFVMGYKPTEVVLVVTLGALNKLNRDELQGVIGHEFSHIFNGDTRINLQLMAITAGIFIISQIGGLIIRSNSHRNKSGGIVLGGFILVAVGYIGFFIGSLIKLAISRQREYLADAFSVQFTRNPVGLAQALLKIKNHDVHSYLNHNNRDDISHFCFSEALRFFFEFLSTHPSIDARIKLIDPNGEAFSTASDDKDDKIDNKKQATSKAIEPPKGEFILNQITANNLALLINTIGMPNARNLAQAEKICAAIPAEVYKLTQSTTDVINIIYAMLYNNSTDKASSNKILDELLQLDSKANIISIAQTLQPLPQHTKLPILELCVPQLKNIADKESFINNSNALIMTDKQITINELLILTFIKKYTLGHYADKDSIKYKSFKEILPEISYLIYFLIHQNNANINYLEEYKKIMQTFSAKFTYQENMVLDIKTLTDAIDKLKLLSPLLKKNILSNAVACITLDNHVSYTEYELLQILALNLDCPMPPIAFD